MQESGGMGSDVDMTVPSVARMYDYYLGGKDNYAVDRDAVAELDKVVPSTRPLAVNNRLFLRRAVRWLAQEQGIRQFLDHGSGLPTQDNVHQVAQGVAPQCRVVYVDNDPIVLAHGRALLQEDDRTTVIQADMRDTDAVFDHAEVQRLIDFSQPVAALFVSVMHCLQDPGPEEMLRRVLDRLPSGSFVVINQLVSEDEKTRDFVTGFMDESTHGNWGRVRQPHEVEKYFTGLEPVEPGLGKIDEWRPEGEHAPTAKQETMEWYEFGGVARKP